MEGAKLSYDVPVNYTRMNSKKLLTSRFKPKLRKGLLRLLLFPTQDNEAKGGYPAIRDAPEATSHRPGCLVRWLTRVL